jgi:hypothetical protein
MAKALSSRRGRGRKAADEWTDGGGEERSQQVNSKARADTIRMAVREQARMEAEIKALNADLREFKTTHIKGDLGMKIADWNAVYRVSQLEVEDRDVLLDTLREGFAALGIGQSLDWVAAAEAEPKPNGTAAPDPDAFEQGESDGFAGHRDHAARYAEGEIGAAAYKLGHESGERKRHAAEGNGAEPAPKRGRGRPRKPAQQPGLSIVEGAGSDTAA